MSRTVASGRHPAPDHRAFALGGKSLAWTAPWVRSQWEELWAGLSAPPRPRPARGAAETRGAPWWPPGRAAPGRRRRKGRRGAAGRAAMAERVREELAALAAIFCGPDEWEVLSHSGDYPALGPTLGDRASGLME